MMVDFKAISGRQEKWRWRSFVSSSRDKLYQLKLNLGLVDVGSSGIQFTWCMAGEETNKFDKVWTKALPMRTRLLFFSEP